MEEKRVSELEKNDETREIEINILNKHINELKERLMGGEINISRELNELLEKDKTREIEINILNKHIDELKEKLDGKKEPRENDKIAGIYSKCPICNYKDFNFFLSGKELISEFVEDLKLIEKDIEFSFNQITYGIVKKWEEKLK